MRHVGSRSADARIVDTKEKVQIKESIDVGMADRRNRSQRINTGTTPGRLI
jgi:hypothetical protein